MTDAELAAIESRANAATAGPWELAGCCISKWTDAGDPEMRIYDEGGHSQADAAFIAAAREDVPKLLAEVRRLREELKTCRYGVLCGYNSPPTA